MSIHDKHRNQPAYSVEARAGFAKERNEHNTPVHEDETGAFYMDTTLGTRTRPAQAAEVRKREAALRTYSGFASRSDILGE